jgi:KaiC/GvpD/RAD55 family RecA-like ATPase
MLPMSHSMPSSPSPGNSEPASPNSASSPATPSSTDPVTPTDFAGVAEQRRSQTSLRYSTGVPGLDQHLGGGLLPGSLTVVLGATGIGKTQLGIQFAAAAGEPERRRGAILDVSVRGDSQSHSEYARRLANWELTSDDARTWDLTRFHSEPAPGQHLHAFQYSGRRVTRQDLDWDAWRDWQAEVNERLGRTIAFLYGHFVHGGRRVVVDGVEPVDRPQDSIQQYLFEYVYHQVIRKDSAWVARDLLRQYYRDQAAEVDRFAYDPSQIACLLLLTSHSALLDDLIARPLDEGDALSNANTLIYMGKVREGRAMRRALYVAKHRGSSCSDELLFYDIGERGVEIVGEP